MMTSTEAAEQDFKDYVLPAIEGLFGKLLYISELKEHGVYEHGALEATYGRHVARSAIARIHRVLFETMLRTDLWDLLDDLSASVRGDLQYTNSFKQELYRRDLLPDVVAPGEQEHLESIMVAMHLLYRA